MVDPMKIDSRELAAALGMGPDSGNTLEAGHHLRDMIPQYVRVQVPLDSVVKLRIYADLLRGLAMQLDFVSRRGDLSDTQALFLAKGEVRSTNYKMLHLSKSSKAE